LFTDDWEHQTDMFLFSTAEDSQSQGTTAVCLKVSLVTRGGWDAKFLKRLERQLDE